MPHCRSCDKGDYAGCIGQKIPVADGGEGSVEAFLEALGGEKQYLTVRGPFFEDVGAFYGVLKDSETAVIEMARPVPGCLFVGDRLDVMNTTTYGVGELMRAAASDCGRIILVSRKRHQ